MNSLLETDRFDGFGPSALTSLGDLQALRIPVPRKRKTARQVVRRHCPALPGVYGMIGPQEELIYVGESKNLRDRLLSYFGGDSTCAKARRIASYAEQLIWEAAPDEFGALLRELELIRRWKPRFNVRGNPRRARRAYLCVGRGPAAQAYLCASPPTPTERSFGPVPANRQYRRSVSRLNDCFGLRDCRRRLQASFSNQLDLFRQKRSIACLRGATGTCLAPCATSCSQEDYDRRVESAVEFVAGRSVAVLQRLQEEMQSAAAARRFEFAARLRDTHDDLARLSLFLERLREVRQFTFVYPVRGRNARQKWYFIRNGQVVVAQPAPEDPQTARSCLKRLDAVFPRGDATTVEASLETVDDVLLVSGWFRRKPGELTEVLTPRQARNICE
jgi:excinuclease ABC subunit C